MSDASTSTTPLPWQVSRDEFLSAAREVGSDGACCVFVIDDDIPKNARSGYAALVIAYARADEPVWIMDSGAAVLVRDGGTASGRVVATRVLDQMRRLALENTLRAGVVPLSGEPGRALTDAQTAAAAAAPGSVTVVDDRA
jgi:hypothetical protein